MEGSVHFHQSIGRDNPQIQLVGATGAGAIGGGKQQAELAAIGGTRGEGKLACEGIEAKPVGHAKRRAAAGLEAEAEPVTVDRIAITKHTVEVELERGIHLETAIVA